jgi:parvulin-like peptidyl-prolyl isomerase
MVRAFMPVAWFAVLLSLVLAGCQTSPWASGPGGGGDGEAASAGATGLQAPQSTGPRAGTPLDKPLVFLNQKPLSLADLRGPLLEAAGGQVLAELVLQRMLEHRLGAAGLQVTADQVQAEKGELLHSLSANADQAQLLLEEFRRSRGWGDERFAQMLWRNAALRLVVQAQVPEQLTDAAIHQAYDYEYGPKYEVRLIVIETLPEASTVVRRARADESFVDLAIHFSTDASKAQGGLLSPLSLEDPTYPVAIRKAISGLTAGGVSDPIALEKGYAVVRLERKIDAQSVKYDDVRESLTRMVRRQVERTLMQRLARELFTQVDLTILDPALQKSWDQQKKLLLRQE